MQPIIFIFNLQFSNTDTDSFSLLLGFFESSSKIRGKPTILYKWSFLVCPIQLSSEKLYNISSKLFLLPFLSVKIALTKSLSCLAPALMVSNFICHDGMQPHSFNIISSNMKHIHPPCFQTSYLRLCLCRNTISSGPSRRSRYMARSGTTWSSRSPRQRATSPTTNPSTLGTTRCQSS